MTPERYAEVKQIFQDAIELSVEERAAYLDDACGSDSELRAEVESLLAAHGAEGTQLVDKPLVELVSDLVEDAAGKVAGRRIGPYRLERLLGEGGMGAVYEAWRADDQFQQRVALKLVKSAAYSDATLRRFRQERQILAALSHTHIARLLDGGVTPEGQPFFVMEYVDGKPIDQYCDEKRLGIRERLALFCDVCAAVQYAHQNLIVHRDLKPTNILVTPDGQVKLLDFGIAKLLSEEDGPSDTLTATGMYVMTPEYASPEQVRGSGITTATDVYSLGVLLYELLTGRRPFQLKDRLLGEIERIICEQEPTKPSTVVVEVESTRSDGGRDRLRRALRGDLDKIVLLALRKEPEQRYPSVEQFNRDVRNYLEGLPVLAQTPTLSYQSLKFLRRHKAAVVAAALVIVAIWLGLISTVWQAGIATRERARAVRRFNDVRQLSHAFLFDFNDSLVSGPTAARKLIVGKGLQYLDTLEAEAGNDLSLMRDLGSGYIRIGDVQGNPVMANLGDSKGAIQSYRKAIAVLQPLAAGGDYDSRSQLALAVTRFGDLLWATSESKAAFAQYQRALELQEKLVAERPFDTAEQARLGHNLNNIGDLYLEMNDLDRAERSYRRAFEISKRLAAEKPADAQARLDLSLSQMKLGDTAWYRGDWQKALSDYRAGTDIREKLLRENPDGALVRRFLLASYNSIGDTLAKQNDIAGAVAEYRRSLDIANALAREDRTNQQARRDLMVCLVNLSELLEKEGKVGEAAEKAKLQLEIATSTVNLETPPSRVALQDLADAQERLGNVTAHGGQLEEAWRLHSAAAAVRERILSSGPTAEARRNLLGSYLTLGSLENRLARSANHTAEERVEWRARARMSTEKARGIADEIRAEPAVTAVDRELLEQIRSAVR